MPEYHSTEGCSFDQVPFQPSDPIFYALKRLHVFTPHFVVHTRQAAVTPIEKTATGCILTNRRFRSASIGMKLELESVGSFS